MTRKILFCLLATGVSAAVTAGGTKMDPALKDKLAGRFQGMKYAVLTDGNVPSMPVGGLGIHFYAVTVENGGAIKKAGGFTNLTQKASQVLDKGELMSIEGVKVTDSGVNVKVKTLRELSAGLKDVGKRAIDIKQQYARFGTEFQFRFDPDYLASDEEENLQFILKAVHSYLEPFATDSEARASSRGELAAAPAPPVEAAPAPSLSAPQPPEPAERTTRQILDDLLIGKPVRLPWQPPELVRVLNRPLGVSVKVPKGSEMSDLSSEKHAQVAFWYEVALEKHKILRMMVGLVSVPLPAKPSKQDIERHLGSLGGVEVRTYQELPNGEILALTGPDSSYGIIYGAYYTNVKLPTGTLAVICTAPPELEAKVKEACTSLERGVEAAADAAPDAGSASPAAPAMVERSLASFGEAFNDYVVTVPADAEIEGGSSRSIVLGGVEYLTVSMGDYWDESCRTESQDPSKGNFRLVGADERRSEARLLLGAIGHNVRVRLDIDGQKGECGTTLGGATYVSGDQVAAICRSIRKKK